MNLYPIDWKLFNDDNKVYVVCINENQEKIGLHVNNIEISCYIKIDINYLKIQTFVNDFRNEFNIKKIILEKKYPLIYYNNDKEIYSKIVFNNIKDFFNFKNYVMKNRGILKNIYHNGKNNIGVKIYEDTLSFILKLLTKKNIRFGEWIFIEKYEKSNYIINNNGWEEYNTNEEFIKKSECKLIPLQKRKILSFDIECYSDDDKKFPNALEPEHIVMMISVVIRTYNFNDVKTEKHIFTCCNINKIEGVISHIYNNEIEMLENCIKFMTQQNCDFIIGYNIWNFDFKYINLRLENIDMKWEDITDCNYTEQYFMKYIRNPDSENILITSPNYLYIVGVICLDLYPFMRRTTKLDNYKLDSVSMYYLNRGKLDVHYTEIFKAYRENDINLLTKVAEYAVEDSNLVIDLFDKTNIFINLLESSKIFNVPIIDIYGKGQTIRVESQVYYIAYHNNYIMEASPPTNEEFIGAVVQNPIPGLHKNILTFDFASLYPSIIRAYNLCYTTILKEEDKNKFNIQDKYEFNIELIDKDDDSEDEDEENENENEKKYRKITFVKSNIRKGLLPMLLENLVNERKIVKSKLEVEKDPVMIKLLDATQNAIKASANSVYGILGSKFGKMGLLDIAQTITFQGRQLITTCAEYLRDKYDAKIVYGDTDSIMVDFNVKETKETTDLGLKISKELSDLFPKPLTIEYEKCYVKYFLVSKKRYAGYKYKENGNHIFDLKGLASTRRDSFPYFKKIFNETIFKIMNSNDKKDVINFIFESLHKLITRQIPIEELIMTGEVAKTYKNTSNCPMKVFVDNMKKNDIIVEPGQRVSFIFVNKEINHKIENDKLIRDKTIMKDGNFMRLYDVYKKSNNPEILDYEIYIKKMTKALDKLVDVAFNQKNNEDEYIDTWIEKRVKDYIPKKYIPILTISSNIKIYKSDIKYFERIFLRLIEFKKILHIDLNKYFEDKMNNRQIKQKSKNNNKITTYFSRKLINQNILENENEELIDI